jgi:hypothetical protein
MIALLLTCLFTIAFIAAALSLTDSWLRARGTFAELKREQRLLKVGFIPQVHAHEVRLRQPARRMSAVSKRACARLAPRVSNQAAPEHGAA